MSAEQEIRFDDATRLTDQEIQMVLREVDTKDLATALMEATESLKERMFSNVSERVGAMLREAMASFGQTQTTDIKDVQSRIAITMQQLKEAGVITSI